MFTSIYSRKLNLINTGVEEELARRLFMSWGWSILLVLLVPSLTRASWSKVVLTNHILQFVTYISAPVMCLYGYIYIKQFAFLEQDELLQIFYIQRGMGTMWWDTLGVGKKNQHPSNLVLNFLSNCSEAKIFFHKH